MEDTRWIRSQGGLLDFDKNFILAETGRQPPICEPAHSETGSGGTAPFLPDMAHVILLDGARTLPKGPHVEREKVDRYRGHRHP